MSTTELEALTIQFVAAFVALKECYERTIQRDRTTVDETPAQRVVFEEEMPRVQRDANYAPIPTLIQQRLNEAVVRAHKTPDYRTTQTGPPHDPRWHCELYISDRLAGSGTARRKSAAKDIAATAAYDLLF